MNKKEVEFRDWLTDELKQNHGSLGLEEIKNSGVYHCDCSQQTIGRYLKKWAHSGEIGFIVTGKYMNGKFIHDVVLNKR
jgi:hypothetical protein